MKNYKKKVSNQSNKIKQEDKESTDINKSVDWKKEREYLFTKIKNLEKEVNSLKTKKSGIANSINFNTDIYIVKCLQVILKKY